MCEFEKYEMKKAKSMNSTKPLSNLWKVDGHCVSDCLNFTNVCVCVFARFVHIFESSLRLSDGIFVLVQFVYGKFQPARDGEDDATFDFPGAA